MALDNRPQPYADDLPDLTPKQMAFVRGLLDGKTATEAYRQAYDVETMSDHSTWTEASKLRRNPHIARWLSAARKAHLGTAILTREAHMRRLEEIAELAIDQNDIKTALGAEVQRGHVAGLRVERSEITINNPAALLHEIGRINPDIARRIAETYSIPFAPIIEATPALTDEQDDDHDEYTTE